MRYLDQIISFLISGTLWFLGVIVQYASMIRNDKPIKLKWFVSDAIAWFLLAGSIYTLVPESGWKVPVAVFVGYMTRSILSVLDKQGTKIIESKIEQFTWVKTVSDEPKKEESKNETIV